MNLESNLDRTITELEYGADQLLKRRINALEYRDGYDNYPHKIGLAILSFIKAIRDDSVQTRSDHSLWLFFIRPLQELCTRNAAVNYYENNLTQKQKIILREARLMQAISEQRDVQFMKALFDDEKDNINKKCSLYISEKIQNYDQDMHFSKSLEDGFARSLNKKASDKIDSIYADIQDSYIKEPKVLEDFKLNNSWVIFSQLMHADPISVLLASNNIINKEIILINFLVRMTLLSSEFIARYLNDEDMILRVISLRDDIMKA